MPEKTDKIVKNILESYSRYGTTTQIDKPSQPSREIVVDILEDIRKLVFPGYFEQKDLRSEYIEYYVGELIEDIRYNLTRQITRAYLSSDEMDIPEHTVSCADGICHIDLSSDKEKQTDVYLDTAKHTDRRLKELEIKDKVEEKCDEFLLRISKIRDYLATDVEAAFDGDPAAYSTDEIIYSYPGLYAITVYRIAHELFTMGIPLIPRMMTEHAHGKTGIDIHPGATIGRYFFIDHGTGIVVGETTTIGDYVKVYQGVTLGALSTSGGQSIRGKKRHPDIQDNVTIYSGASILGGETVIGEGSTIGGNAFITSSVPANTTVLMKNPELIYKEH